MTQMFSLYSCVLTFIRHVSLLVAVKEKGRPVIDHNLPPSIQTILRTGFHPNQIHRPTMHVVYNTIPDELSSLKWECGKEELRDSYIDRRRSYISIGEEWRCQFDDLRTTLFKAWHYEHHCTDAQLQDKLIMPESIRLPSHIWIKKLSLHRRDGMHSVHLLKGQYTSY